MEITIKGQIPKNSVTSMMIHIVKTIPAPLMISMTSKTSRSTVSNIFAKTE